MVRRSVWPLRQLALASLFLVFVFSSGGARPADATFPGYNGKLVFTNQSPPGEKIVVINPNGTARAELTGGAARDDYPVWSPDGQKIAFSRGVNPGRIWIMNADGSDAHQISPDDTDDYSPTWSPDGTKIAFETYRDGNPEIYVMNADGANPLNLTTAPSDWDLEPAWSPDGTKIAFVSERDGNGEIYVMNADGSGQTRLTNSDGSDFGPKWTADSSRIFWGAPDGIRSMNPNGTDDQFMIAGGDPAPSPDGELVAFGGSGGLYTMKPDGTDVTLIPDTNSQDYRLDWQPLAEQPAYAGDADCDGDADAVDSLHVLRNVAGLANNAGCLANANVKCDDGMTSVDALLILRYVAQLPVNLPQGCPAVGSMMVSTFR